jgi:predicted permease
MGNRVGMLREWLHRLWGTVTHRPHDRDLEAELRTHMELAADDARQRAHDVSDGLRAARIKAGGPLQAMEALRDQRGLPVLEDLVRDLRFGLRTLRRSPVFTIVSVLTLAVGIGANAAVFQLLDGIRFRELPVQSPEQLVTVTLADLTRWQGRRTSGYPVLTNALWEQFRDDQRTFDTVFAWANAAFRLDQDTTPRSVRGLFVSGEYFGALGVAPILGRVFSVADDRPGCGLPGAVVSYGFWQRQFGGDPTVIGRAISVNGKKVELVGVTPTSFFGVEVGRSYDVAVPICSQEALGSEQGWLRDGSIWWLTVMGRMAPGQTLAQVNAQLDATSPSLFAATLPGEYSSDAAAGYLSLRLRAESASDGVSALRSRFADPLVMLVVITGLVLLIVCTNLASLVLSRESTRQREFAMRQSLGASRRRLVQQVMVENGLLALAGASGGLALAGTLSRLLLELLGPDVAVPLRIGLPLVGVIVLSAILTCLTLGLIPAWRASRSAAVEAMKGANLRGSSTSAEGFRFRQTLVVLQVAVSFVLMFGALLFVGTLRNLLAVESGFHSDGVAMARIDSSRANTPMSNRVVFKRALLERVIGTPGVTGAAEVRHVPMTGTGSSLTVWRDGADPTRKTTVRLNAISDGYLRTMGVELLSGRDFTPKDSVTSPQIALVNPSFARRLGIVGNPVGARFRAEGPSPSGTVYEIIGLVADTKYFALREEFLPIVFVPVAQIDDPRPFTDFVIRSSLPLARISSAVRGRLREISSSIDVEVRTFDSTIRQGLARERLMAAISAFFGVVAVLIAAIGLYGTIAEMVTRRRGEIGVRIALGARRGGILTMVLRHAATLLMIGLGAGAAVSFVAGGLVESLIFGLDPHDLRPIGLACACLAAVALGAALVPACRAAMLEPLAALREE